MAHSTPVFDLALVEQVGSISTVLRDFLDRQAQQTQLDLGTIHPGAPTNAVRRVLSELATADGTKQPMRAEELVLTGVADEQVTYILQRLQQARVLREADGVYELTHDTLARHIADSRSGDEKKLRDIAKVVHERRAAYGTTSTYLSEQELQLVRAYATELREQSQLMADADWAFVQESRRQYGKRRFRKWLLWGGLVLGGVFTLLMFVFLDGYAELSNRTFKYYTSEALRAYEHHEPRLANRLLQEAAQYGELTDLNDNPDFAEMLDNLSEEVAEYSYPSILDMAYGASSPYLASSYITSGGEYATVHNIETNTYEGLDRMPHFFGQKTRSIYTFEPQEDYSGQGQQPSTVKLQYAVEPDVWEDIVSVENLTYYTVDEYTASPTMLLFTRYKPQTYGEESLYLARPNQRPRLITENAAQYKLFGDEQLIAYSRNTSFNQATTTVYIETVEGKVVDSFTNVQPSIDLTADGSHLLLYSNAIGVEQGRVQLWSARERKVVRSLPKSFFYFRNLVLSGNTLLHTVPTSRGRTQLRLMDLPTGKLLMTLDHDVLYDFSRLYDEGRYLFVTRREQLDIDEGLTFELWDVAQQRIVYERSVPRLQAQDVYIYVEGSTLVFGHRPPAERQEAALAPLTVVQQDIYGQNTLQRQQRSTEIAPTTAPPPEETLPEDVPLVTVLSPSRGISKVLMGASPFFSVSPSGRYVVRYNEADSYLYLTDLDEPVNSETKYLLREPPSWLDFINQGRDVLVFSEAGRFGHVYPVEVDQDGRDFRTVPMPLTDDDKETYLID